MLMNSTNSVIYIGVTTNLIGRIYQHKHKLVDGFTKKYNVDKLVYFEIFDDIVSAITREKQLKAGSRRQKVDLITKDNPKYKDLYDEIID